MGTLTSLWRLSVVKKIVMALTGLALCLFVLGHLLGNLKIYLGPLAFNEYAAFLRTVGHPLLPAGVGLWIARLGLLVCLVLHVLAATQLYVQSKGARDVAYERYATDQVFSRSSLQMRWGGVTLGLFILFHLAHLTWGWLYPGDYIAGDPYHNVVSGFQHPWLAVLYIAAMAPLCLHLYHGVWSMFTTLGLAGPGIERWRRPLAGGFALLIFGGNVSIPLAALFGILPLAGGHLWL
jgi:succinate dehydrogenase / fumarate reductase cytochrome b subunit